MLQREGAELAPGRLDDAEALARRSSRDLHAEHGLVPRDDAALRVIAALRARAEPGEVAAPLGEARAARRVLEEPGSAALGHGLAARGLLRRAHDLEPAGAE